VKAKKLISRYLNFEMLRFAPPSMTTTGDKEGSFILLPCQGYTKYE